MSLLALADLLGISAGLSSLATSLNEKKSMAEWVEQHFRPTTLRFVERSAAGERAGI